MASPSLGSKASQDCTGTNMIVNSSTAPNAKRGLTMIHLKTKEECRLSNEMIDVWTLEMPSKHAEKILKVIKDFVPGQDSIDLQHLRRFAKPKYLPAHVLGPRDYAKDMHTVPRSWDAGPPTVIQSGNAEWQWSKATTSKSNSKLLPTLYLMVCPSKIIPVEDLYNLLKAHTPFRSESDSWAYPLDIKQVSVPLLAPTTQAQATSWSAKYWPTFYRKTNPFGAHPAMIEKAETELQEPADGVLGIDTAFALAEEAAVRVESAKLGAGVGCVIIERNADTAEIIAVAGDARNKALSTEDGKESCCQGNVMAHAVMRAIGMVGRKRLRVASQTVAKDAAKAEGNFATVGLTHDVAARDAFFVDLPVNDFEKKYFDHDNIKADGYLCLKLEVYTTHEPCMMCSMALVHSRVGRVVFKHRMPETGGLTAEKASNVSGPVGLGYGLCWRKELNWQFMCWEYRPTTDEEDAAFEAARQKKQADAEARSKGEQPSDSDQTISGPSSLGGADERELHNRVKDNEHHPGEKSLSSEHEADMSKHSFAGISV